MIGIYSPFWHTRGGGERYILSLAKALMEQGEDVRIISPIPVKPIIDFFNLDFMPIEFRIRNEKELRGIIKKQDLLIYCANDRAVKHSAQRYIQIQQIALSKPKNFKEWRYRPKVVRQLKKAEKVLVYSHFVKEFLDDTYGLNCQVLYPAVEQFAPGEKKNIILSVGRFFRSKFNSKRYEDLIGAFKQMNLPDWEYHIVGSCNDWEYAGELAMLVNPPKVVFHFNAPPETLASLYAKAKIFWHAAGYGTTEPENMESFGISIAEALTAGCYVLAHDSGASAELLPYSQRWHTLEGLQATTRLDINQRGHELRDFGYENFAREVASIFGRKLTFQDDPDFGADFTLYNKLNDIPD